jgi:hypothetical protein
MELALVFQIISSAAVVLGIIFGILNLRNFQAMRKREAAVLMLNSFQTNEFVKGLLTVLEFGHDPTKEEIDNFPEDKYLAFYMLLGTWERLGILVFRREIDILMVEDAYSGPIVLSWRRLEKYVSEIRAAWNRESAFEWFQWLAECIIERDEKIKPPPAYLLHRSWKP